MYVLYWMVAARRTRQNPALARAAALARELRQPLVVLEALAADPPWATPRVHRFVIDGMLDNAATLRAAGAVAYPYVERVPGEGKGLVDALAAGASAVVTDLTPILHLGKLVASVARRFPIEVVDGNGLLPLAEGGVFSTAHAFRRHLQKSLPAHLAAPRDADPLRDLPPPVALPAAVLARWPMLREMPDLGTFPALDRRVAPVADVGGPREGARRLREFVRHGLGRYADRNDPDADATSGLAPYLHFGHVGAWEVFDAVAAAEGWSPHRLAPKPTGSREGWWGMSAGAEGFLDQVLTWRELGFQYCHHRPDYADYATLPDWARATLDRHRGDPRPARYTFDELADAATHDEVWNAAQRQLVAEGRIHNYLRMLWAKRVMEWTDRPETAWAWLIELNNRWALDGRDPNSYTGIAWSFGRFDRPWGPERPVYGTVRYMSSARTVEKLEMADYLRRWSS